VSGATSRRKGAKAEREAAGILGLERNARNGLEAGDLATPPGYPYALEVKRRARALPMAYAALEQAAGYAREGQIPAAVLRDDRKGWLLVVRLEDALKGLPPLVP